MSQAVKLKHIVNHNHAIFNPKKMRTNEETYNSLEVRDHT
jgi:hypothetical protein